MGKHSLTAYLSSMQSGLESGGSGEFTIDLEKALAKLSRFSLETTADIFLKAVQAGVAGRAEKIELAFGCEAIEVIWKGLANKSTEAVAEAFLLKNEADDPFVSELIPACRALLEEAEFGLYGSGALQFLPGLDLESDPKHQELAAFRLKIKRPRKGALATFSLDPASPEFWNFSRRLEHCPVPLAVFVEGSHLPLESRLEDRISLPRGAVHYIACSGGIVTQGRQAEWASPLTFEQSEGETHVWPHCAIKPGQDWAEFWCVATHGRRDEVRIRKQASLAQFVRYGVVCAESSLPAGLAGARLVLHCEDAKTNLTGLSLDAPWSQEELRLALDTLWADSQNSIRHSLQQFPKPPDFLNDSVEVPPERVVFAVL